MATEVEIRTALADVIRLNVASIVTVLPRDIMNLTDVGWMNVLRDPSGFIRGWTITQNGAPPLEPDQRGGRYRLWFDVWQWFQYRTGNDAQNSEDESSAERELIMLKFSRPDLYIPLPQRTTLDGVGLLDFPRGRIGTPEIDLKGHVRIAKGEIYVDTVLGC